MPQAYESSPVLDWLKALESFVVIVSNTEYTSYFFYSP